MDSLAVELLEHIFTMACIDGGYTGCSLSLVSKRVRATSRVARFHSIALASGRPQQVAQFTTCIAAARAECKGATPKVRHLLLASAKRDVELSAWPKDEDDTEQLKFSADVVALLHIIAPDVHTLALIHGARMPQELRVPFAGVRCPSLREFTFVGTWRMPSADGVQDDWARGPDFPSLTRLHLRLESRPFAGRVDLPFWTANAPRLTHLRVSNLGRHACGVVEPLKALALDSDDVRSFPELEQLVVQPGPGPLPGGKCGNPYTAYRRFLAHLQEIRHQAKRPFVLVDAGEPMAWSDVEGHAWREWLDRVSGGPGCWDV